MTADSTWAQIPEGWAVLPFDGELPPALYRYRSLGDAWAERRIEEVLDEVIFLAAANTLNDPDEGIVRWRAAGSYLEAYKVALGVLRAANNNARPVALLANADRIARNMLASPNVRKDVADQMQAIVGNLVRIVCFTTSPLNGPMWTHYGNFSDDEGGITPHGGLCIEYAVDESWRRSGLRPVQYADQRPEINMLDRENREAQFAYAAVVKSRDWSYEQEWRSVAYLEANPPLPSNLSVNSKFKLQGAVKSVILGLNANSSVAERVANAVRASARNIAVKRVVRDESSAALKLEPL